MKGRKRAHRRINISHLSFCNTSETLKFNWSICHLYWVKSTALLLKEPQQHFKKTCNQHYTSFKRIIQIQAMLPLPWYLQHFTANRMAGWDWQFSSETLDNHLMPQLGWCMKSVYIYKYIFVYTTENISTWRKEENEEN